MTQLVLAFVTFQLSLPCLDVRYHCSRKLGAPLEKVAMTNDALEFTTSLLADGATSFLEAVSLFAGGGFDRFISWGCTGWVDSGEVDCGWVDVVGVVNGAGPVVLGSVFADFAAFGGFVAQIVAALVSEFQGGVVCLDCL